jgi:UDP-N-acetylmuramoyl-L-alanyl-D-glutamate--2,6-diaminopimelate ligase
LVLEVTSHGIDQNRIWGIPFAIAGITNVTHEHLDYHKTYDNYLATKARLLTEATVAVINKDDASFTKIKKQLGTKHAIVMYGKEKADITPQNFHFTQPLPGAYNLSNSLLAIAITKQMGIADGDIRNALKTFTPPIGRTEIVYKKDFTIMIDFAHTPNAFEQLLSTLRPQVKGRLIHVFGSAGLRDKTKRPFMGKASATYADILILTSEDPRSEKIEKINEQIKSGIPKNILEKKEILEIPDRQEAILKAISFAQKDDFILLTGKAHEKSINYGKGEIPWSEHEAVKKALVVYG